MLTNQVVTLQVSSNLLHWDTLALLDHRQFDMASWRLMPSTNDTFAFVDPGPAQHSRFYRFCTEVFSSANDWKNQALLPNDGFLAAQDDGQEGNVRWVKFAILLDEPLRVIYQDSRRYLLHYDFAVARLAPFAGMDRPTFDSVSLFHTNHQILLGALLLPPRDNILEYGIQFAGRDPWPRELVRQCFDLVCSTVATPPEVRPYYFPSYEQSGVAEMEAAYFAAHGIRVSSVSRWFSNNQVYSPGWALGRIQFVAAANIDTAYTNGTLSPLDILLTDGVPVEVPYVAGIISLAPATPNSHVAILANSYGVPFVHLANPADRAQAEALAGQEAILQASVVDDFGRVSLIPVEGNLDAALRAELLALKTPPRARIQPKTHFGAYSAPADGLTPNDIRFFGGKAAYFGFLRRAIPNDSPVAIAFSFDLWDDFMGQTLASGRTLSEEIRLRLSACTNYPPDFAAVRTNLAAIRNLITRTARFATTQQQAITDALALFDPLRNIRFRSSSNAEDSETFTAAGLYDSYSGCLADDLDGDGDGPCICDPEEGHERGVFRAMQKVYASFYNDNAFLERLRHGIDETQVGMALLVHHSTPDPFEMANGVATLERVQQHPFQPVGRAMLVTQAGAVPITNPEGHAIPEVAEGYEAGGISLVQPSSLVPLGSHVMQWPGEYTDLTKLLFRVYDAFTDYCVAAGTCSNISPLLDFEYKKVQPGCLMVKQVRPLPPRAVSQQPVYVLNQPATYWVYQREGSDAFANHRLKCNFTLQTYSGRLDEPNLAQQLYTDAIFEAYHGRNRIVLTGPPSSWPDATHSVSNDPLRGLVVRDGWSVGSGTNQWRFELRSVLGAARSTTPFLTPPDIRKYLTVTYPVPMPVIRQWDLVLTNTLSEEVQLVVRPDPATLQPETPGTMTNRVGITLTAAFLTSTNALGPPIGVDKHPMGYYPIALSPWTHTQLAGLLATPLELHGYWSQSTAPSHHNLQTWYLLDPRREPELPAPQWAELEARNIDLIFVMRFFLSSEISVVGLDRDGQLWFP